MAFRGLFFLLLITGLGGCAQNTFSNSSSESPSTSNLGSGSTAAVDAAGNLPSGSGSAFIVDGFYYALEYKTYCADGGPIAIILISNSASQAMMTRQSCVNLSTPRSLDVSKLAMSDSVMAFEGLVYIPHKN